MHCASTPLEEEQGEVGRQVLRTAAKARYLSQCEAWSSWQQSVDNASAFASTAAPAIPKPSYCSGYIQL